MPNPMHLAAGDVEAALGGENASPLGQGTFGETWRVENVTIAGELQTIAAKFLKPEFYNANRAQRETDWLARMNTDSIVRLFDVIEVQIEGVTHTVLLCEYICGGSVHDALTRGYPSETQVIAFARALMAGVEHVHSVDAVHRDIKPANVMLRDGDWSKPVLIDFGLVKGPGDATITLYPQQVGTVLWMAPEQLRGDEARKACDIWACGVIIYQLVAEGAHPYFDPERLVGVPKEELAELVEGPPRPLPASVSPLIRDLIDRFLSQRGYERGSAARAVRDLKGP